MGVNPAAAGLLGGMGGGIVQAYATMGKLFDSRNRSLRAHNPLMIEPVFVNAG